MSVLEFVEASEYRKARARQLAQLILANVSIDGILGGGDLLVDDILAVLSDDLAGLIRQALRDVVAHSAANGFGELSLAEAQATVRQTSERVLESARASLIGRLVELEAAVQAMLAGSSALAVSAALESVAMKDALLAPINAVLTQTAAGVIQAVEAGLASEAVAQFVETGQGDRDAPPLLEWQTREDDHVCGASEIFEVSCSARHGKQLTFQEWEVFGLPGDPDAPTICAIFAGPGKSRCRCGFIPAGSAASTPTPVNITEAAKAGRERAIKEAA